MNASKEILVPHRCIPITLAKGLSVYEVFTLLEGPIEKGLPDL